MCTLFTPSPSLSEGITPLRFTVLIVDDYAAWRRSIRILLQKNQQYDVIAEAADGVEAIDLSLELRPDIILMDLSLPKMNGIDAAGRILAKIPSARIVFVSEHGSPDLIAAVMSIGAAGYVVKSRAARELLPAMDAVARRGQIEPLATGYRSDADGRGRHMSRHDVAFYGDEDSMLDDYARVAATVLRSRSIFVIVAGTARQELLRRRLETGGTDVAGAIATGRYHSIAARDFLARVMVCGSVDEQRFWSAAALFRAQVTRGLHDDPSRIVVCGECAPRLLAAHNVEAALHLESLWDQFARTYSIDTLCGYLMTSLDYPATSSVLARLRHAHSAVAR